MNPKDARIIYMGTPEFAVEPLRALVKNNYNVVAVVTVPDKPAGRGQKISTSAVKDYALSQQLPILQPEKLKEDTFLAELKSYQADLQIVVAFRMLPEVVWAMPPMKTFNLHASLLPNYRGAAPINWAIINGERKSGVTTFFIQHDIDTGNIIMQEEVAIGENTNIGELYETLMHTGARLVTKSVDDIVAGKVVPQKQDESLELKAAPKIFKDDCRIDWTKEAQAVHNLVRGLSPYPAAWTVLEIDNKLFNVKLFATQKGEECDTEMGTLKSTKKQLWVATADAWLEITELQIAGKKRMKTSDLLCGYNFEGGRFI